MYLVMSESTPDFFWRRLKLALCRVSTRRIIDNVEACHLAEWEQEQPLCLFLLAPLSQPDQILGSNPAVPITIAALVIAVVDSTIIVEDPFPRLGIVKNWKFASLNINKIRELPPSDEYKIFLYYCFQHYCL